MDKYNNKMLIIGRGFTRKSYLCNNAMLRYKKIIGPNMKAREIPQQKTEGGIAVRVLNRMTSLGMPESYKVS